MRFEWQKELQHFLEDVDEQIQYQPMHAAVNEELKGHVEDKAEAYMEYGLEEDEAYKRALRDMGDASAIGIQMNEAHHLRTAKPLLILMLAFTAAGIVEGLREYGISGMGFRESMYALWGLVALAFVMQYGYPLLLRHAEKIMTLFVVLGGIYILLHSRMIGTSRLLAAFYNVWPGNFGLTRIFSPSLLFGIFQLAVPVMAVILYHGRHQWFRALLTTGIFQIFLMWVNQFPVLQADYTYTSVAALLVSCLGMMLYMVWKGYADTDRKKGFTAAGALFLAVLLLWAVPQREILAENLEMFFQPETGADSAWTDNYNNVLVRELLGRSEWVGKPELTQEELLSYHTSQWYYENGPGQWNRRGQTLEEYTEYQMQFQKQAGLTLVDAVPQRYGKNYQIFRWIMEYGRIPALILLLLLTSLYVVIFATAFRIRNRLGRLTALGGSLALTVQFLFYVLGNFGCQFGNFGNLPFLSEGFVSITGTAVLTGLVLSAYRFDTVVMEKD